MNALTIENLSVSYPDQPDVLAGINLTIAPQERVGIIGPNGVGKTTLFHTICGVVEPQVGQVHLFDTLVKPGTFHPEIGLVFQYPDDQLFSPSVYDDIAFGPRNMGLEPEEVDGRVQRAMALTGIGDLGERPPHHLSGGQKRMVAIAGVQAMRPQIIIYDEPSANLDIRSRRRLIRFIQESSETILVSSHDLELVLEVCERVVLIDHGRIIADDNARTIMGNRELMETHGLETPHSLTHRHNGHTPVAAPDPLAATDEGA